MRTKVNSRLNPISKLSLTLLLILGLTAGLLPPDAHSVETKNVILLRVYFDDYAANSRYTKAEVEAMMEDMNQLWVDTSYGNIDIDYQVTDLYELPDVRTDYIDDLPLCEPDPAKRPNGDLSCDPKFEKVLEDAINASDNDDQTVPLDWADVDLILVLMAETSNGQFHRGQGTSSINLPKGPGGAVEEFGGAIFSENPTENDREVMGRWAHEVGHTLQQGGPAHPSNYNSEFELMDSNMPGQTGPFEKMSDIAFPGWLPEGKYQEFDPESGGGFGCLWAMEYDPADKPNYQVIKANITDDFYYLVSVRRRVLGDDLNGQFSGPNGIPDEGVIIERVSEGANPWVTVMGKGAAGGVCNAGAGCDRDKLWQVGDVYDGGPDGIFIDIRSKSDDDNYCVYVTYDQQAFQPDVMLRPWRIPPGNTYESTDIWVDSPINGWDNYRYGIWDDGTGNLVPRGNGDDPAVGHANRIYARVRNVGLSPATNVEVTWHRTDPPGLGIAGANGWVAMGTVDKGDFAALVSIPAGDYVDVYTEWTPDVEVSPEDLAAGTFYFHTCIRVSLNHVAGETVFGNQEGEDEQENVDYFQVPPEMEEATFDGVINLRNDDPFEKRYFRISYSDNLPDLWNLDINGGDLGLLLDPGEVVEVPITIKKVGDAEVGEIYGVDVRASSLLTLENEFDEKDLHTVYNVLGGVRVDTRIQQRPTLTCYGTDDGYGYRIWGRLEGTAPHYKPREPFKVAIEGVDGSRRFLNGTMSVLTVYESGDFDGYLAYSPGEDPVEGVCLFAGTEDLMSASSGFIDLDYPCETYEICDNGIDDDCDGMTDLEDPECAISCYSRIVPVTSGPTTLGLVMILGLLCIGWRRIGRAR